MTDIQTKFFLGATTSIISGVIAASVGATQGFIYAKFADLPVAQSIKAYAVWYAAELAIVTFATAFVKTGSVAYHLMNATVITIGGIIGIQELQKRGLIGEKMTMLIIVLRTLLVAQSLISAATCSAVSTELPH